MKMVKIRYSGKNKEYLEFPEKDCKRSCEGSLHLRPGAVKEISEDEYAHIKKAYSHLKISQEKQHAVRMVKKSQDKKVKSEKKVEVAAKEKSEATDASKKTAKKVTKVKAKS